MLKEIRCTHFSHKVISFHRGLNVIRGDNDGKNSIGKSTMLTVIDFALGGSTLLKDEAGAIRELGHHRYNFAFEFGTKTRYFSRSTDGDNVVQVCSESYAPLNELSLEDFNRLLKQLYRMENLEHTFRSAVNPFARIWKKGGLDPSHPFAAVPKEAGAVAVGRLIDLFGRSPDVAEERRTLERFKDLKRVINDSMAADIIPNVTKAKYSENRVALSQSKDQIEQLRDGFGGALNVYEALFDDSIQHMRRRKSELAGERAELQNKVKRLERDISGITPRLAANIALVADFFPTVDVQRLEQV
ncbi:ATP-binding protein, partial [Stenotrophomonas lactitubi]|uniref:ATP-binding protein n=1 Tax=Stenotrophomonas lactitubi TaxID=2045214 RepID=UPI0022494BAB